jgi:pimeloyl-[acyl-carrier protein] methyl ester esterase
VTAHLLLVHGWGFDASFWTPLRAELGDIPSTAWDLGFLGSSSRPALPDGVPVVAVGHSMGLLWLLHERPAAWRRLVSINGFSRFAKADGLPQGVAPRLLERMIVKLAETPGAVYADFMSRCGLAQPPTDGIDAAALEWGLRALADWDCRGAAQVDLALAGRSDPVAPPALSEALFPPPLAQWHDGGHLLPLTDPVWCAQQLRTVVESLK